MKCVALIQPVVWTAFNNTDKSLYYSPIPACKNDVCLYTLMAMDTRSGETTLQNIVFASLLKRVCSKRKELTGCSFPIQSKCLFRRSWFASNK